MKPTIFMPKTIKAGFRKAHDAFTGKLAYVIYYDEKDNLRKEKSWNNWRQKGLGEEDFENKPTSGFFINKKTGGYKSGWNYRKSYIRVYDPRGFEFEITVENLVYILEHVVSSPESGLEGEFVYGWDKADLVLIPVNSPDYKDISKYNEILHDKDNRLKVKDLTIGGSYKTKDNDDYVYVGRKDIWDINYDWRDKGTENYDERTVHKGKYHSFIKMYEDRRGENFFGIINVKSPSGRFIQEVSSKRSKDFDKIMEHVNNYYVFNAIDENLTKLIRLSDKDLKHYVQNGRSLFINDKWYIARNAYNNSEYKLYRKITNKNAPRHSYDRTNIQVLDEGTVEELNERNEIYDKKFYLTNGKEFIN